MKRTIDKILNNFVFFDKDINHYTIDKYPTPERNVAKYEVSIWTNHSISSKDVSIISERLETAFKMLGFRSSRINLFNDLQRGEFLIKGVGDIDLSK